MKSFKKLLVVSLSALLSFGVASCGESNTSTSEPTPSESVTPSVPANTTHAADIMAPYLETNFGGEANKNKTAKFSLPVSFSTFDDNDNEVVGNFTYSVEVLDGGDANAISLGEVDGNQQYFNVVRGVNDVNVKVTIDISVSPTDTAKVELNFVVVKLNVVNYAKFKELADAGSSDVVDVLGTVVAIYKDGLYIENDAHEGFYAYSATYSGGMAVTDFNVGDVVVASGTATKYSGQYEFASGCTVALNEKAPATYAPTYTDLTSVFNSAKDAADAAFEPYQNRLVEVKDVMLAEADVSGGEKSLYYYFEIGNVRTYIRPYTSWINPETHTNYTMDELNAYVADWGYGYTATLKGLLSVYSGKYYLSIVNDEAINVTSSELSDALKVKGDLAAAVACVDDTYTESVSVNLTTASEYGATVTWSVVDGDTSIIKDNVLTIAQAKGDKTYKIKVTVTLNDETVEQEITIVVKGVPAYTVVEEPVAGASYKFALYQGNLDKHLYFSGNFVSSKYLSTSAYKQEATDVKLTTAEGGYHLSYVDTAGATKYVGLVANGAGKANIALEDTAATVWTFNTEHNTLVSELDGTTFYLGTYSSFDTLSASKLDYAATSFVAHLVEVLPTYVAVTAPVADTEYVWSLNQANLGKDLYFSGEFVNGKYLSTSASAKNATPVKLTTTEGGYHLSYVDAAGATKYVGLVANGTGKANIALEDTAATVWTFNTEHNTLVSELDGTTFYLGTYGTFDTISASKLSYAATSFVSHLYQVGEETYSVTLPTVENVTLSSTDTLTNVAFGSEVTVNVAVTDGYTATVKVNGNPVEVVDGAFKVVVKEDVEITAEVEEAVAGAATATFTSADLGLENAAVFANKTDGSITFVGDKGTGSNDPKFYTSGSAIRFYGGNTFTISVAEGYEISSIVITTVTGNNGISDTTVTLTNAIAEGFGTATVTLTPVDGTASVVLTNPNSSGNFRIVAITVNYAPVA